jgi:Protein of unknown function (DUF2726)/Topoisomerase DNA binding C4 zinc finger
MMWFVLIIVFGVIGYIVYRADKNMKAKYEDKFNPADWDLPTPGSTGNPVLPAPSNIKYQKKEALFSPPEKLFFNALQTALANEYQLLAKLSFADLVEFEANLTAVATSSIANQKVNFMVCDKNTLQVLCAIEITDSFQQKEANTNSTSPLATICKKADIPLVSVTRQMKYDAQQLRAQILNMIQVNNNAADTNPLDTVHNCPKCSATMVKRKSKKQGTDEKRFWVCHRFPECKGVIEITD